MPPRKLASWLAARISLARYRGPLPVAASLALSVVSINFCLLWLTGAAPRGFVQAQAYLDWKYFEQAADTVAGLVHAYRASPGAEKKPFLLYTGLSTAIEGVDPRSLAAHDGCDAPVVGICATGGSMYTLLALQEALLRSDLSPSLVVVCLHPEWLAGLLYEPPESLNPIGPLRRADWREAVQRILWWDWIRNSLFYSNQAAFKVLYTARLHLGTVASVDPWRQPEPSDFFAHQTDAQVQAQMARFAGFGWFDRRRYALEQETQAASLRTLISSFRARGAEVLLVILPEASAFRTRVPPEAKRFLLDYLRREFIAAPPPVFDYRDAIPDSGFSDYLHMNDAGRAEFTIRLAAAIRNTVREYPQVAPCMGRR
jgi:hypothetical protein